MRAGGMPKRSIAESVACAEPIPSSVGSLITTIFAALMMNGRTVAANGCGASTTTSPCSGSLRANCSTASALTTNPSSYDRASSTTDSGPFLVIAGEPGTRPRSSSFATSYQIAIARRPERSASTM